MRFDACERADAKIYRTLVKEHSRTSHCTERENRLKYARGHSCVAAFYVERGHRDGPEIHCITDNGCIVIFNRNTHRLITVLIARPGQIDRYLEQSGTSLDNRMYSHLIDIAISHQRRHLNHI